MQQNTQHVKTDKTKTNSENAETFHKYVQATKTWNAWEDLLNQNAFVSKFFFFFFHLSPTSIGLIKTAFGTKIVKKKSKKRSKS